jgi:hypothetical protein
MTKNFSATDIAGAIIQNIGDQMYGVYTTFPAGMLTKLSKDIEICPKI